MFVGDGQVDERPRMPAGVIAARRAAAPPVRRIVGWPRGQIDDAHVAPEHAVAQARAERLGAGLLGGEALGVGGGALGARAPSAGARSR